MADPAPGKVEWACRLLKIVNDAVDKDARHAKWLPERGWPSEFARTADRPLLQPEGEPSKPPLQITYHLDKPLEEMLNFPVKGDIDLERLKPPPLFDNNDGMG